jgi:hypothetical protein
LKGSSSEGQEKAIEGQEKPEGRTRKGQEKGKRRKRDGKGKRKRAGIQEG